MIDTICVVCGLKSPEAKFIKGRKKCNKCRAAENKKKLSEYGKKKRMLRTEEEKDKDSIRTRVYREKNPHAAFASTSRYHAKKHGCHSDITMGNAQDIHNTANVCNYCGKALDGDKKRSFFIDHIIPLIQGGHNSRWNLTKTCPSCNSSKGSGSLIDFFNSNESFTQERFDRVIEVMSELSGLSHKQVYALLEQSNRFEVVHAKEKEAMERMLSLLV